MPGCRMQIDKAPEQMKTLYLAMTFPVFFNSVVQNIFIVNLEDNFNL